jgi:hypothetical protein
MKSKTTIELNGTRYDATTGTVMGAAPAAATQSGRNIDGFFRGRSSGSKTLPMAQKLTVLAAPTPAPKPGKQPSRGVNHARAHTPQAAHTVAIREQLTSIHDQKLTVKRTPVTANHTKAHATQGSTILMRKAVKRPAPSLHKQLAPTGSLHHAVPSLIVPKLSAISIDAQRLARAQSANRNPHIAHHTVGVTGVPPLLMPLPVQPVPVKPEGEVPSTSPAPMPTNKPSDIFEHALANATNFVDMQAHKKHFKKHARRHVSSMAAGTLALLVIAGFAAYQNTPGIQLKIASVQAGVATNMPNFKAAGFAYNGAKAESGKLTVGFSSQSAHYQLVQQTTNLSGSDIIQNIGATDASGTPDYRTLHTGTTTVYRFDNTNATWVQNGKWYTVTGTGALTDTQVKNLVSNV